MRRFPPFLALLAFLVLAAPAAAKPRDRDRDRMPDRWERKHHLNVHKRDTRKDPDRDGLRNSLEYKAGTNPRDRDSDDDGLRDGREVIGKIKRLDLEAGTLVIRLLRGGSVSGEVDSDTVVECQPAARSAREPISVAVQVGRGGNDDSDDGDADDGDDSDAEDSDEDVSDPDGDEDGDGDEDAGADEGDDSDEDGEDLDDDGSEESEDDLEDGLDDDCGAEGLRKGQRVYGAELIDGFFVFVQLTR